MKPLKPKSKMNKTEEAYSRLLELLKRSGDIIDWRYEAIRFRLGSGAYYKPDFLVVKKEQFEIHEVKGYWREAAKVRIKTCAALYPWFRWVVVRKSGGSWELDDVF